MQSGCVRGWVRVVNDTVCVHVFDPAGGEGMRMRKRRGGGVGKVRHRALGGGGGDGREREAGALVARRCENTAQRDYRWQKQRQMQLPPPGAPARMKRMPLQLLPDERLLVVLSGMIVSKEETREKSSENSGTEMKINHAWPARCVCEVVIMLVRHIVTYFGSSLLL
jgi:hypothetical protein